MSILSKSAWLAAGTLFGCLLSTVLSGSARAQGSPSSIAAIAGTTGPLSRLVLVRGSDLYECERPMGQGGWRCSRVDVAWR